MPGGGSKPGERRGGRKKGTPNKSTAEVKGLAQQYTSEALERLARVMRKGKSDAAIVAACREILDRGHGKAHQSHEHTGKDGGPIQHQAVVNVSRANPARPAAA